MGPTLTLSARPLPELRGNAGWWDVPIAAVDEPLLAVADVGGESGTTSGRVRDDPQYVRMGHSQALSRCYLRAGVLERLEAAAASLPDALTLVVWDGWRPLALQAAIHGAYLDELTVLHPDWPADALEAAAARFVTPPSRDPTAPPPHLTGGAVDLTLGDRDGRPLDLGTGFDAFVPEAGARALEDRPGPARAHRRTLFWAMAAEGFTAYTEEWWHFDLGDQFWGLVTGRPARYGGADPPG